MEQREVLEFIVENLDLKKAEDIEVLKIRDLTIISDYFIIATATSTTHVKSLADEIEFRLKQKNISPTNVEGYDSSTWILLDYSDIIIHIFTKDQREHYSLGRLWQDGEKLDISHLLK